MSKHTKPLRTSDIAAAVGAHVNTVRMYEEWGFLPLIPRGKNGYRQYTAQHRDQMILAWTALHTDSWYGPKRILVQMVRQAAQNDLGGAMEQAYAYLAAIHAEIAQAEAAVRYLERWFAGHTTSANEQPLRIGEASARLGVTRDVLRNWESNGLITTPRDPKSGYRLYGPDEIARLRVIRMLRQAGYSMMAVLRLTLALDAGRTEALGDVLETPGPFEDVIHVTDTWLTNLRDYEAMAHRLIEQLEAMIATY